MQRVALARFQRHGFHLVHDRRLVCFRRFVHDLDVSGAAQPFRISDRQAERQSLVTGDSGNVEGRFRFGAVGEGHRRARDLRPLVGNGIAIRIGRSRAIQGHRRRTGYALVSGSRHRRMVGHYRINRRSAAACQAFIHRVQNVSGIGVDRPGKQTAQVFRQHILTFRRCGTRIFIGDQIAGGFVKQIRRFSGGIIVVFPARFAFVLVNDLTIVNHARFPGPFHHARCRAGERVVIAVTVNAGPAATIHGRPHDNFAGLYTLRQQRIDAVFGGVIGIRFVRRRTQCRLVTQIGIAPAAVEVVAHQEDVIHVLLGSGVINVFNFVAA